MTRYFPELGRVNKKSLKFVKMFVIEWVRYFPFFWLNCPVKRYWDYFGSSYRVSLDSELFEICQKILTFSKSSDSLKA